MLSLGLTIGVSSPDTPWCWKYKILLELGTNILDKFLKIFHSWFNGYNSFSTKTAYKKLPKNMIYIYFCRRNIFRRTRLIIRKKTVRRLYWYVGGFTKNSLYHCWHPADRALSSVWTTITTELDQKMLEINYSTNVLENQNKSDVRHSCCSQCSDKIEAQHHLPG